MSKSGGLGDIPGNRVIEGPLAVAAIASGGANARLGQFGPYPFDARLRSAWYSPLGADLAATQSATYRQLTIQNGGSAGTATTTASRMASLAATITQASLGAVALVVDSTITLSAGQICFVSQATVGGTDANGTVLPAGQVNLALEIC